MHKNIRYLFLLVIILGMPSSTQSDWRSFVSEHHTAVCALTLATACIIGKISYDFYNNYLWPHERVINCYRTTYATIYDNIQQCYHRYKNDTQLSDWDIKEYIATSKAKYPFITYIDHIVLSLYKLEKHYLTIDDALKYIAQRKKQVIKNNSVESILFIEEFAQLETKGRKLQKYIAKTCTILTALKHRITLFHEYDNDYHEWSYAHQKEHNLIKQNVKQKLLGRTEGGNFQHNLGRTIIEKLVYDVLHDRGHAVPQ